MNVCYKCDKVIDPRPIDGLPNALWLGISVGGRRFHDWCYSDAEIVQYAVDNGLLQPCHEVLELWPKSQTATHPSE